MKLSYDPTTDSLYIHLLDKPSFECREISDNLILDFDESGILVGIDLQHAGKTTDLGSLTTINIPYRLE